MFLKDDDRQIIIKQLSAMTGKVKIIHFSQMVECTYCHDARKLLEELIYLSDKLSLEIYNFQIDTEEVRKYNIDKIPATILIQENGNNSGMRFFGIPSGYEFMSIIEDIVDLSNNQHGFSNETYQKIRKIDKPVHIQVFVTPTCPECPAVVRTAHRLALVNKNITADMVDVTEFPHLVQKYNINSIPKSIINATNSLDGVVSEQTFIDKINTVLKK